MASTGGKISRVGGAEKLLDRDSARAEGGVKPSFKVVAHLTDGRLVKGHTDVVPATDLNFLLKHGPSPMPEEVKVRLHDANRTIAIPLTSLKALFFVKSFEGSDSYKEIKFFEGHPAIEGLWARMKFRDGEWTEGVIRNSHDFLIDPGFLVKPPDPQSNNEMVYVVKTSLLEFQVLGVRHTY
ncbi:MAG: hypothetical protein ABSB82_00775 [Terriglobia bacterium]|jgi:hypothetical protein